MSQRKSRRLPVEEESFTNEIGQVIQVNDSVAVVTKRWGGIGVHRGLYLGVRKTKHSGYHDSVSVVVELLCKRTELRHKETNRLHDWRIDKNPLPYPAVNWITTKWNASEEQRARDNEENRKLRAEYDRLHKEYQAKSDKIMAQFKRVEVFYKRRSHLQRNRVFKI